MPDNSTASLRAGKCAHEDKRVCPVCGSDDKELLHRIHFSTGDEQEVSICQICGMGYASLTPEANYDSESIYAATEAAGSGDTARDRKRFRRTVEIISNYFPDRSISILDIGCAQGGLLTELQRQGYENVKGMDPSQACVDICHAKGLAASRGRIEDPSSGKVHLLILSHVLEHVWDVPKALDGVKARLTDGGYLYVEVPNASVYADYLVCPFLDFNREHINHFSRRCLREASAHAGLNPLYGGERELDLPSGKYPAIYEICQLRNKPDPWSGVRDTELAESLIRYVKVSEQMMGTIDLRLRPVIAGREIIVWGYGEFAQQLFLTEAVNSARVVQVVDRDPRKQGKLFNGLMVQSPDKVRSGLPILVASILNKDSIQRDFHNLRFSNELVVIDP